jgi:hypothetical protein
VAPSATQLTVNVPELADARSALAEVRDGSMRLVAHVPCGATVEVAPGLYVASVTLPSGGEYRKTVEVRAAQHVEVVLGPERLDAETAGTGFALESAVVAADLSGSAVAAEVPDEPAPGSERCWVRLVSGASGKPLGDVGSCLRMLDASKHDVPGIEIEYAAIPSDAVLFAQVAVADGVPQNVALPAAFGSAIDRCRLHILLGRRGVAATALPAVRTSTALIASYLVTGNLRTAANVAQQAEHMLADERNDPVGATLGAYALLRLGRGGHLPEELTMRRSAHWSLTWLKRHPQTDHWLCDLAERCEWLPDGAIVAGELARRNGRDDEADAMIALALRRGLPMFSDGLSLLVSDLRSHPPGWLRRRTKRLLATSSYADYGQLGVVLPGMDPTRADDCQHPPLPLTAAAGWQPFERPS